MKTTSLIAGMLIAIVFFFTECKKSDTTPQPYQPIVPCSNFTRNIDSAKKWLTGKWDWVETKLSVGNPPNGFIYKTLQTEGYTIGYIFRNDTCFNTARGIIQDTMKFGFRPLSFYTNKPADDTIPMIVFYDINNGSWFNDQVYRICPSFLEWQLNYAYTGIEKDKMTFKKIP